MVNLSIDIRLGILNQIMLYHSGRLLILGVVFGPIVIVLSGTFDKTVSCFSHEFFCLLSIPAQTDCDKRDRRIVVSWEYICSINFAQTHNFVIMMSILWLWVSWYSIVHKHITSRSWRPYHDFEYLDILLLAN